MAKLVHDDVLDGALNIIKDNVVTELVCATQPTDRADALSKALADVAVGSADVTVANGDTNGRKATIAAKSGVLVDAAGTGDHIALIDGTRLLYVTTMTSQVVAIGNLVNIPAWDIEIADPT